MISDLLRNIMNARFGKDVRQSIHDAIQQCYIDATGSPESISGAIREIEQYKNDTSALVAKSLKYPDYSKQKTVMTVTEVPGEDFEKTYQITEDGWIRASASGLLDRHSTLKVDVYVSSSDEMGSAIVPVITMTAMEISSGKYVETKTGTIIPVKAGDRVRVSSSLTPYERVYVYFMKARG